MLSHLERFSLRSCRVIHRQLCATTALSQMGHQHPAYATNRRGYPDICTFKADTSIRSFSSSHCSFAKGKDKKGKHKSTVVQVDETEMAQLMDVEQFRQRLEAVLERLQNNYVTALSVRTSIGALETLPVSFDGDNFPLNELAQVARKSGTLVVINCAPLPEATEHVLRALHDSGMGLNPQQEATTIYVQIPKVTREHRENLAKSAKTAFNAAKDKLRDVQNKQLKSIKGHDEVSEDLSRRVQAQVTTMTTEYTSRAEKLLKNKTSDLLGDK